MTQVILVDEKDQEIGQEEKIKAHELAKLHRAFSVFVFNSQGELMLQLRAKKKYHGGGLWTNTCCSHPLSGEPIAETVARRLKEEMGFTCPLTEIFTTRYNVKLDHGLTENEIDHIFVGVFDGQPRINPEEADAWRWADTGRLQKQIAANPEKFTPWFLAVFPQVLVYRAKHSSS